MFHSSVVVNYGLPNISGIIKRGVIGAPSQIRPCAWHKVRATTTAACACTPPNLRMKTKKRFEILLTSTNSLRRAPSCTSALSTPTLSFEGLLWQENPSDFRRSLLSSLAIAAADGHTTPCLASRAWKGP